VVAVVDYYMPSSADEVALEFLDKSGVVLRHYSSKDPVRSPDPATDPEAYNKLCQATPNAPDCGLPLYWPAPPQVLKASPGMHRFTWDMHYDPLPGGGGGGRGGGGGGANGAVPHRTYPGVNSPWVAPGVYTVKLTANGQSMTQPITIKMDPRVKITPEVQQIFTLTTQLETYARNAEKAQKEARAMLDQVKGNEALTKQIEALAPAEAPAAGGGGRAGGGRGGRGGDGAPATAPTLTNIGAQLVAAAMAMQGSEMPPTAAVLANCRAQEAAYYALMQKWAALKAPPKPKP